MCKESKIIPYYFFLQKTIASGAGGTISSANIITSGNTILNLPVSSPVLVTKINAAISIGTIPNNINGEGSWGNCKFNMRLSLRQVGTIPTPTTGGSVEPISPQLDIGTPNGAVMVLTDQMPKGELYAYGQSLAVNDLGYFLTNMPAATNIRIRFFISIFTEQ